jgi:Ca2+-binding RTX toxin-like protein
MPIDLSAIPGAVLTSAGNYFDPTAGVFINPIGANNKGYPEYYPKEGGMYYPNLGRYMTNEERFAKEQSGFSPTEERKPVNAQTIDLGNNLERIITTYNDGSTTEQVGPKSESSALPYFLAVAASGAGDVYNALSGAGAGSGSLASNLTVGEAASAITNPTQIVTKPITNTLTDYVVNAINSSGSALPSVAVGDATSLGLTTMSPATYATIKTGVGMVVNGVASELLGGDFKEGATGTLAGTILNNVPIPGSGDLLGTNKDVPFTSLVGNLATKGLDVTGISDLSDKVSEKLSNGIAKGTTAGLTTLIAGGNSDDIYRNTGLGAIMGTFGDTKIPGTKLTGDDALELIQDSFAEGTDATNLINDAAGKVVVKADVDPLDQFDPTDFFTGAGFGDDKKTSVAGGSGNDTIKPAPYDPNVDANREDINKAYVEVLGRAGDESGLDFWDATGLGLKDIIDLFRGSDEYRAKTPSTTVTAGGGNDTLGEDSLSITGGGGNAQVTVTGDRDSIGDTISDYIDLGGYNDLITSGSGNDTIKAGQVTVTAADCYAKGMGYDPKTNSCYDLDWETLFLGTPKTDTVPGGGVTVIGGKDSIDLGSGNDSITLGSGNDTITDCPVKGQERNAAGDCVCPPGTTEQNGECKEPAKVTVTAADCYAKGMGYNPQTNSCFDLEYTTLNLTGGAGNDTCPPGTTKQADGQCKPSLEVTAKKCNEDQYKGADGNCYCLDPDQAPNSLGLCQDTTSDTITVGGGNDTVKSGGGNDTITECPTGYTFSSKTGKCEFDIAGLPALIGSLGGSDKMPGSYNPNLAQPFTAARTYKAPPETYDYAGADTVGYEDPYFQRFGPIVYSPPANYTGAGNPAATLAGGGVVEAASVNQPDMFFADGGLLSLAQGGRTLPPRYLGGITDGMADRVPAHIDGERPAALSDGEFVIPADVVSHLGNGNSSAGAKVLYEMMDRVRKARTGTKKQGREIDAHRFMPR